MKHNENVPRQLPIEDDQELDTLLRWSLQVDMRDAEPSGRVWERIQASLEGGAPAFPEDQPKPAGRPSFTRLVSLAAAVCLAFGVMLSFQLSTGQSNLFTQKLATPAHTTAPVVISNEDVQSGRLAFLAEKEQIQVQKSLAPEEDPLLVYRHRRG